MIRVIATASLLALAGCAAYSGAGLQPGVATEAQVRETMGPPAMEFPAEDGGRRLAYPKGPFGTHTYMAEVGRDGRLVAIRQVLSDDTFRAIRPGDRREDVLRLIGPPRGSMAFPRLAQVAWDWRYTDDWGYLAIFSVTFDAEGRVASKFSQRIERDKGRG